MILVDKRIGSKELALHLPPGSFVLTELEDGAGDASFLGSGPDGPMTLPIGVERKAWYDLFDCFMSGRLNTQLQRMTGYYGKIYLIIEGRPRVDKSTQRILAPRKQTKFGPVEWVKTKIPYSSVDNYLNTITDELHIQVKRSFDVQESAWQLWDIYVHCNTDKHGSHLKMDTTWAINPYMPPSFKKRVAAQLDLVGKEKAGAAADHFKSVYDMVVAEEDEWRKIPGFGKILASSVYHQFRGLKD